MATSKDGTPGQNGTKKQVKQLLTLHTPGGVNKGSKRTLKFRAGVRDVK